MTRTTPSCSRVSRPAIHRLAASVIGLLLIAIPVGAMAQTADADPPYDPWMGVNRKIFAFSMGLDHLILAPIAHTYMAVIPSPVRGRVSAVVDNLSEPGVFLNDVAQGHPRRAGRTTARFALNSTVGILGIFDVAAKLNLPSHDADFGQTLGRYGAVPGPYLYVPLAGPSNIRDGLGRVVDLMVDPVALLTGGFKTTFGQARIGTEVVDTRARADGAFQALNDATDPYVTARSAYSQNRAAVVRAATGQVETLPDFDDVPVATFPEPASSEAIQ